MKNYIRDLLLKAWEQKNALYYLLLLPLSYLFYKLVWLRRQAYRWGVFPSCGLPVPVVVVGNISWGGAGKTPLTIWLAEELKQRGFKPGIISRGYGGSSRCPTPVFADSNPAKVGDEPVLMAKHTGCPVWVGRRRVCAGWALLETHPECDVIISDDGLQHYALRRDYEIVILDKPTLNHPEMFPAGTLREPMARMEEVNAVVYNGHRAVLGAHLMQYEGAQFYNLAQPEITATPADFNRKLVKAIAGIGHPRRFFEHLGDIGLYLAGIPFDDHHRFTAEELDEIECEVLVMTEKDAVKCKAFARPHHWVLPVKAKIEGDLMTDLVKKLTGN